MSKHAYMIMAHNEFDILKKLMQMLDYVNHDLYIMIDKKSKFEISDFQNITSYSNVYWVERQDVYWGDYSQVEAEITLLEEAIKGKYSYYHLLSGVDLPLKNPEYLFNFFEGNGGKQFVELVSANSSDFDYRFKYYYLFREKRKILTRLFQKIFLLIQKLFRVDRTNTALTYGKGANWFSITHDFATYVISHKKVIEHAFKHGLCVDEVFLQTMLLTSGEFDFVNNNYRFVAWDSNHISSPKILTINELNEILSSNCLFARKFGYESKELIEKLEEVCR